MPQHQGPLSRRLLLLVLLLVLVVAVAEFALAQPTTSEPDSTFERDREGQCAYCMAHMLYETFLRNPADDAYAKRSLKDLSIHCKYHFIRLQTPWITCKASDFDFSLKHIYDRRGEIETLGTKRQLLTREQLQGLLDLPSPPDQPLQFARENVLAAVARAADRVRTVGGQLTNGGNWRYQLARPNAGGTFVPGSTVSAGGGPTRGWIRLRGRIGR